MQIVDHPEWRLDEPVGGRLRIVLGTETDMEAHMGHDQRPYRRLIGHTSSTRDLKKIDGRCIAVQTATGVRKEK